MLNNFIYAKLKSLFEEALNNGEVLDEAIVFIEDTKEIWNHGTYFDGNKVDLSDIEASILNILDNYATKTEIPTKLSQLENDANYIQDDVIPENGLYIYDTDGRFTLPENWNTINNSKAVGVAILTDDCRFIVAKEDAKSSYVSWGSHGTDISTLTNYTSKTNAATDFDGVNNTSKIIAAIGNTNDSYRDGTAAGDCAAYTFPNGKTGYLGAAGEWQVARQNKEDLNSALTLIGGTTMKESAYWTSTEYSSSLAWQQWFNYDNDLYDIDKNYGYLYVRAFLAPEIKPLKERVLDLESSNCAYKEINHGTGDTTFTLTPNTFHVWDEVTSLDLSFAEETAGVANEYLFQFTSGATATTLTLPEGLKWTNIPTISENMIYLVSILKGIASMLGVIYKIITKFYLNTGSDTIEYTIEEGMTWGQFVDSNYNNGDFAKLGDYYVRHTEGIVTDSGANVRQSDIIVPVRNYIIMD